MREKLQDLITQLEDVQSELDNICFDLEEEGKAIPEDIESVANALTYLISQLGYAEEEL